MFHISVELPELGVGEKGMHLHYLQCSSGGYEIQHYKNVHIAYVLNTVLYCFNMKKTDFPDLLKWHLKIFCECLCRFTLFL